LGRYWATALQIGTGLAYQGKTFSYAYAKENSCTSLQNHVLSIGGRGSRELTGTVTGAIPEALKSML
jgi:hypothetical protein